LKKALKFLRRFALVIIILLCIAISVVALAWTKVMVEFNTAYNYGQGILATAQQFAQKPTAQVVATLTSHGFTCKPAGQGAPIQICSHIAANPFCQFRQNILLLTLKPEKVTAVNTGEDKACL
jgi:hypothetical protein